MTATKNIEKTTENQQIIIFRSNVKKSFTQLPNWLVFKMAQKLPAREHHGWCLLSYLISLDPNSVITPKILSEKTGHRSRSIYTYMKYLIEVGHVRTIKIRGVDARFITTIYEVYANKFSWKNTNTDLHVGEIVTNNNKNLEQKNCNYLKSQQPDTNTDLHVGEIVTNNANSYNARARAGDLFVGNTSSNSKAPELDTPQGQDEDTTALSEIGIELENSPSFDHDLVKRSLDSFGPKYTLGAIRISKQKNKANPGAYFRGAAQKKYQWIEDEANQPPPSPYSTMSECNIQGYRTDFLEVLFKNDDDNFQYFLDLSDEELAIEERFKKYLESKGYNL